MYRLVSSHQEDLDSGRELLPGEFVELSTADLKKPRAAQLVAEGKLVKVPAKTENKE